MTDRIGVAILKLLYRARSVWIYVALAPCATRLLEGAPVALELVSAIWRVIIAAVVKAAFVSAYCCWRGRKWWHGDRVRPEGRARGGGRLRLGRRRRAWDV